MKRYDIKVINLAKWIMSKIRGIYRSMDRCANWFNTRFENIGKSLQIISSLAIFFGVYTFYNEISDRNAEAERRLQEKIEDAEIELGIQPSSLRKSRTLNFLLDNRRNIHGAEIVDQQLMYVGKETSEMHCSDIHLSGFTLAGEESTLRFNDASEVRLHVSRGNREPISEFVLRLSRNYMPASTIILGEPTRHEWANNDLTGSKILFQKGVSLRQVNAVRSNLISGVNFYFQTENDMQVASESILANNCIDAAGEKPWFQVVAENREIHKDRNVQSFQSFNDEIADKIKICEPSVPNSNDIMMSIPVPAHPDNKRCATENGPVYREPI